MVDFGPISERSPLLHLVDALTAEENDAPGLLVQVQPDWAAVALKPSGILLVIVDASMHPSWEAIIEKASGVLRTEQAAVLSGLAPAIMAVVLLSDAASPPDLRFAPSQIVPLERAVHWIVLGRDGSLFTDERAIDRVPAAFLKSIDRLVAAAHGRTPPRISPTARQTIERHGEAALAGNAQFRDVLSRRYRGFTIGIIAACAFVFGIQLMLGPAVPLVKMGALQGRMAFHGHYEMLLSYSMLHGGYLHIFMNCFALQAVGTGLENIIGGPRMLFVFTLSALGGGVLISLAKPDQLVVGASAGIFGLITALYGLSLRSSDLPALAAARIRRSVVSTLLINLFISLLPGVSLLGHAGGALVGLVLGASGVLTFGADLAWRAHPDAAVASRMTLVFRIVSVACALAIAGSVALAFMHGRPWE